MRRPGDWAALVILPGMSEHPNARLIREFHDAQNRFYAGGDQEHVRAMLAEDVAWHVPGRSAIAGDYGGRDEVLGYFLTRRELARATFRIHVRGVLADDERAVIFAGGQVERHGETSAWETVGVFRIADGRSPSVGCFPMTSTRSTRSGRRPPASGSGVAGERHAAGVRSTASRHVALTRSPSSGTGSDVFAPVTPLVPDRWLRGECRATEERGSERSSPPH